MKDNLKDNSPEEPNDKPNPSLVKSQLYMYLVPILVLSVIMIPLAILMAGQGGGNYTFTVFTLIAPEALILPAISILLFVVLIVSIFSYVYRKDRNNTWKALLIPILAWTSIYVLSLSLTGLNVLFIGIFIGVIVVSIVQVIILGFVFYRTK